MSQLQKQQELSPLITPPISTGDHGPAILVTFILAGCYVLSGVTQPLIMTLAKDAGLADASCQLYMLFYYMGPATVTLFLLSKDTVWPSRAALVKAACIAGFDLFAQALNYTGSSMAGPTIFAIIYSSVTVWTAVFSRLLLSRSLTMWQWLGISTVFGGLTVTGFNSVSLGPEVFHGACLVIVGSIMHALTYVMSEAVMTKGDAKLSVPANCAVQGIVCTTALLLWQLMYTRPRFTVLILQPMQDAHTTIFHACGILVSFTLSNFIHSICFFHTLRHFPGGSTSAGVMKALQAVLVFVVTSWAYCGRIGGKEMCFSHAKLASLVIVIGGVMVFGKATEQSRKKGFDSIDNLEVV